MTAKSNSSFMRMIDRKLRSLFSLRRAFLRVRSIYTGHSYSTLKLRHVIGISLNRVLIVERDSGYVFDEWDAVSKTEDETCETRSAIVAKVGEIAKGTPSSGGFSPIEYGGGRIHIHARPTYITAACFSGRGVRPLGPLVQAAFIEALRTGNVPLHFTRCSPAEFRGASELVAAATEKLLLDADLPPHGKVPRPIFAYSAIAGLSLLGIAATGDIIAERYGAEISSWAENFGQNPTERSLVVKAGGSQQPQQQSGNESGSAISADAGTILGRAVGGSRTNTKSASNNDIAITQFAGVPQAQFLTWEIDRSLMQFSLATDVRAAGAPVSLVDDALKSALAQLPKFDPGLGAKPLSWTNFNGSSQPGARGLTGKGYSNSLPPVSVDDQGFRVGLFSTGGNSVFGSAGAGQASGSATAEDAAGSGAGSAGALNSNLAGAASATSSAVSQTIVAGRGLGR